MAELCREKKVKPVNRCPFFAYTRELTAMACRYDMAKYCQERTRCRRVDMAASMGEVRGWIAKELAKS